MGMLGIEKTDNSLTCFEQRYFTSYFNETLEIFSVYSSYRGNRVSDFLFRSRFLFYEISKIKLKNDQKLPTLSPKYKI